MHAFARDAEAEALREWIAARRGARAVTTLALVMTTTRNFPMLKYALGHGRACVRVRVADQYVAPLPLNGIAT